MKVLTFCLLLLLLPCNLVHAKSLDNIHSVTDLIVLAIDKDYNLKISDLQLEEIYKSQQRLDASLKPQFNISGEYIVENLANQPLGAIYVIRGADYEEQVKTKSGAFTIVQQLGLNNQLKAAFQQVEIGQDLTELQKDLFAAALVVKVQENYCNLLKAYSGMQLAAQAVEHSKLAISVVREKESNGVATPLDVLKEQNNLYTAENQLLQATNGVNVSLLALTQLIGLDLPELDLGYQLADRLYQAYKNPEYWDINYEQALNHALNSRLELKLLAKKIEQAHADYMSVVGERDWTVSLKGHYLVDDYVLQGSIDSERRLIGTIYRSETTYPEVEDLNMDEFWDNIPDQWMSEDIQRLRDLISGLEASVGLTEQERDADPWQVTLNLNYQFGLGGAKKAAREQAALGITKAEIEYEQAKEGIELEIYALYQQVLQARNSLKLSQSLLSEAQETYQRLGQMYELGLITKQELSEGKLFVGKAEHELFCAMLEYEVALGKFGQGIGLDLVELISGVAYGEWPSIGILEAKGRLNL